jgi:hypothetical protein
MNNAEPTTSGRDIPVRTIPLGLALSYAVAMTILVLSQADVLGGDWVYVGLWLALLTALNAFFFGYSLAVTAESRQARRAQKTSARRAATPPADPLSERPRELTTNAGTPRR